MKTTAYKMFMIEMVPPGERSYVEQILRKLGTPAEAQVLASDAENLWSFVWKDHLGLVGDIRYRGITVGFFYKRDITAIDSEACDPAPENVVKDPEGAWLRFEFFNSKAAKVRQTSYQRELKVLRTKVQDQDGLLKQQRSEITLLQRMLDSKKPKPRKRPAAPVKKVKKKASKKKPVKKKGRKR